MRRIMFRIGLMAFIFLLVTSPAHAIYQGDMFEDYETVTVLSANLTEGNTTNVSVDSFLYSQNIVEAYFAPGVAGTWELKLLGLNPLWYQELSGAAEVAWKDSQGDNQWHTFTQRNVNFGWFTNVTLYSGSASISYRIRFACQYEVGGMISATPIFLY